MSEADDEPMTRAKALELCGLTQSRELAELLDLSESALSKWEGDIVPPRHRPTILAYAKLRKSRDELMYEPAKYNVRRSDLQAWFKLISDATQTNQLDALARIAEAHVGLGGRMATEEQGQVKKMLSGSSVQSAVAETETAKHAAR